MSLCAFRRSTACARAQHDNVIVALPFHYTQAAYDATYYSAEASIIFCMCCLAVNVIGFFGGFTTFNLPLAVFRAHLPHAPRARIASRHNER